jgi:hypothetical protein
VPANGTAVFDVERFGWTAPDRLEVAGRWSGVRGLRFVRPTIDVPGDGSRRRLLALLEHKPWAPVDGEQWVAAFPWEGEPVALEGAVLAVAPSVVVALPAPSGAPRTKPRRFERAPAHDPELIERARDAAVIEHASVARERDDALRERDEALAALRERGRGLVEPGRHERQLQELRTRVEEAEAERADALEEARRAEELVERAETERDAALERAARAETAEPEAGGSAELAARAEAAEALADELRARAEAAEAARDDALRRAALADELRARAEAAEAARDAAQGEADALRARADQLLVRAREAEAARDAAERDATDSGRVERELRARLEAAESAHAAMARERDAIRRGAREALARVEAAEAATGAIAAERDAALAERDEALAQHGTAGPTLVTPITPPGPRRRHDSAVADWAPRLAALAAFLFLLVVLALLFRGI